MNMHSAPSDAAARVRELAAMPALEYEKRREAEAKALGFRLSVLDAEVERHRPKDAATDTETVELVETVDPWPDPVSGLDLAEEIRAALIAHVVFPTEADADAAALWTMGTWTMGAWRLWPKLLVQSPEKRCGKSTLLEVIEAHVSRGLMTSNITAASLFRCIESFRPTLLIDEADRFLRENEEANGIINAGHTRRTARVIRTVEVNGDHEPRAFSVWGAQAIAGIGRQLDTLEDRAIRIDLRRRLSTETVARLPVDYFERRKILRQKFARWAEDNHRRLSDMDVEPPPCGNDRARDNWTPIFQIAAALGGPWPERASRAYAVKEAEGEREETAPITLLRDVMGLFQERNVDRLQSADIVAALLEMEDRPWGEWKKGRPMSPISLSRLLKPFGIRPRNFKAGGSVLKGYDREGIEAAFRRYCDTPGIRPATPPPLNEINGLGENKAATAPVSVADEKTLTH